MIWARAGGFDRLIAKHPLRASALPILKAADIPNCQSPRQLTGIFQGFAINASGVSLMLMNAASVILKRSMH
jgi:hypothetical protein